MSNAARHRPVFRNKISINLPHQGTKECARRVAQMNRGDQLNYDPRIHGISNGARYPAHICYETHIDFMKSKKRQSRRFRRHA